MPTPALPLASTVPAAPSATPTLASAARSPAPSDASSVCYIQVLTPATKFSNDAAVMTLSPCDSVECCEDDGANGITGVQLFAWGSSLTAWDYRSRYDWLLWLLPCVAVPQIELRMGLISNFWVACGTYLLVQAVTVVMAGFVVLALFDRVFYSSDSGNSAEYEDGSSRALSGLWLLVLLSFLALQIFCLTRNLAVLRLRVRSRLSIPGSYAGDLRASFLRPTSVVRQMGRQLRCDEQPLPCCSCWSDSHQVHEAVDDHEFIMSGHV